MIGPVREGTHMVPDRCHVKLTDLSPPLVEQAEALWLRQGNRRTGGPLDPQTVLHTHRMLHAAMQRAVRWRLVPVNPVDGVEPPHVPAKERDFLTADESEQLVAALVGQEYGLPILVGLYCGLRPTEYLALRWRDVDLETGVLRVTQNMHHRFCSVTSSRRSGRTPRRSKTLYGVVLPDRVRRRIAPCSGGADRTRRSALVLARRSSMICGRAC
jgi:integrase